MSVPAAKKTCYYHLRIGNHPWIGPALCCMAPTKNQNVSECLVIVQDKVNSSQIRRRSLHEVSDRRSRSLLSNAHNIPPVRVLLIVNIT